MKNKPTILNQLIYVVCFIDTSLHLLPWSLARNSAANTMANLNPNDLNVYLNNFSLSFLQGYHQTGDKHSNLFYSPISLASTLLLLLAGADGSTQQELVDLLGLNDLMKNQKLEVAFKKVG